MKSSRLGWLSISSILSIIGCSSAPKPYAISIDASDVGGLGFFEQRALRKNLEWAIDSVTAFLDQPFKDTLQVIVFEKGYVGGGGKRLQIGKERLNDRNAMVFGIPQVLTKFPSYLFKTAGLSVLMQRQFTRKEPHYLDILTYLLNNEAAILPIDSLMNNSMLYISRDTGLRRIAFVEAGSFYQYLLERGGLEKFREFYRGGLDGFVTLYGAPVDSLDAQWRRWLFSE